MGRIHRHGCSRQTQERMGKRARRDTAEQRRVYIEPYREKKKRIHAGVHKKRGQEHKRAQEVTYRERSRTRMQKVKAKSTGGNTCFGCRMSASESKGIH